MGEVYRATDTRLARDVALKLLPETFADDAERLARFEREAKLLGSLSHSGIAHVYGFERVASAGGRHAHVLVMELAEGEDLAARLERGALPPDEAIAIARQVAEALEEAHAHGIVHRDLKPANVRVARDGRVKVLDFGLAKAWTGEAATASASAPGLSQSPTLAPVGTAAGLILGTAAYMSPEQARGRAVDSRSDVWAFGVLLYEMLTGRRLFAGETVSDILASVLKNEPDWAALPRGLPPPVGHLLRRCLERDVKQRLQAIGEARIVLESGSVGASSADAGLGQGGSRLLLWAVAAVAASALLAAAGALALRGRPAPEAREVLYLDVSFPGDIEAVAQLESGSAISPDGRVVTLTGVRRGVRRLFWRPLDGTETIESAETGVTGGAFSPDGQSLALLTAANVTVFSLVDRQRSVAVKNADLGGAVAWGESGIVFMRDRTLWIVKATGGEPRRLTTLDAARGERVHTAQLPLPGGQTVLFTSYGAQPGSERVEAVDVGNGTRHTVMERAGTPTWSPTGHLLFSRDGAVLAVPFDPAAAETRGRAVTVIPPGVVATSTASSLGMRLSASGSLLYVPHESHSQRLVSVARDGSARAFGLPRGRYTNPRIAPDGRRVTVERGGMHLELLDLGRGTHTRLSTGESLAVVFSLWNRDGSRVVFRRSTSTMWLGADGSGKQGDVPQATVNDFPSGAGPDPDSFLVTRVQAETSGDVVLVSMSGAFEPRALIATPAYEGGAQLSPDRRWITYVSNESGAPEIYVRRYPDLDRQWQVSEGGGSQPRWSVSGREVYYRGGTRLAAVTFDGSGGEPALGKPTPLFEDEYDLGQGLSIANYDVTPDGRFLMLRREAQGGRLRLVLNWTEELRRILAQGGVR